MIRRQLGIVGLIVLATLVVSVRVALQAHELERTQVSITFRADGAFLLEVSNDPNWLLLRLESFALRLRSGQALRLAPGGPEHSRGTTDLTTDARDARLRELVPVFVDRIVLFVDGHEIRPSSAEYLPPRAMASADALPGPVLSAVEGPVLSAVEGPALSGVEGPALSGVEGPALSGVEGPVLSGVEGPATFRLRGHMPANARTLRWLYGLVVDPYPLTIRRADGHTMTEWITGTDWSGSLDLSGQFRHATRWDVARDYLSLGYTHILPKGVDHLLFVLGLFLLSVRVRPILIQVTTFTIAHSLTLGLTMLGVVALPSRVVEPLIALSIVYVAVENLVTRELKPWRLALVFSFGLLHGMGFAGVLTDLGLPRGEFLTALLSFNLGVEAGQLTVIGLAFLLVAWYRHRDWYRRLVVVPASLAIATVGVYWTIARAIG